MSGIRTTLVTILLASSLAWAGQASRPGGAAGRGGDKPAPDMKDVSYGPHERNVLDLWQGRTEVPAPLLVFIHGGGFSSGSKEVMPAGILKACLAEGISVASISYRLSQHAPFPAPMLDGARAIQFLRSKAREYKIDPKRIAASGGSAGAGMSLWLGFHDDLASPDSDDPILRQSSRLTCMAVMGAQSTYDPRWIRRNISPATASHPALLPFYGLKRNELDSPKAYSLYEEASPITHLTKDDPPAWLFYSDEDKPVPQDAKPGAGIHHPAFGRLLKEKMIALGIECVVRHASDYRGKGNPQELAQNELVSFLKRQFATASKPAARAGAAQKVQDK